MSARPDWMPSKEDLLPTCHNESLYDNCGYDYAGEEIVDSHYRTGLRAKLSVLEEEDLHMVNFFQGTYNDENRTWRQAKIAALRKELEG